MTERLLQYIWQFQYFSKAALQTTDGQELHIINPGMHNNNQGPDFLNAKIRIDKTTWAGSIELHIRASDWIHHDHGNDPNYNNVILHVVWEHNVQLEQSFPTLELQHIVSKLLLHKYAGLMQGTAFIPCQDQLPKIDNIVITSWKERLLVERLEQKCIHIESMLSSNSGHWEETLWWMLARNFGGKINKEAFEKMAHSLPVSLLAKHRNNLLQLEALLMGQSGLLHDKLKDPYAVQLVKEYGHLQKKYKLKTISEPMHYLRMRPANFPPVRLAQLARLLQESSSLFSKLKETTLLADLERSFIVTASAYWNEHYVFDTVAAFQQKTVGKLMIQQIMINTMIPLLYAYGQFNNQDASRKKALQWLLAMPAENNHVSNGFGKLGVENKSGWDSQALIQLKNEYCDQRRCLQCAIGNKILGLS